MNESPFPFGAPAENDAPAVQDDPPQSRRLLLVAGGLVGALVLGASAFLLLGGSPDEEGADLALPAAPPAVTAPVAEPQPALVVPAATTQQVGRNPFRARYVAPVAAAAATEKTAPAPAPPIQVVVQPAPAQTEAPSEYPITLTSVQPSDTAGVTYTWTIGGKPIEVFQGQRFGTYGELVVLALESADDGPKAVLQVGDDTPIRVKVGETVNVL